MKTCKLLRWLRTPLRTQQTTRKKWFAFEKTNFKFRHSYTSNSDDSTHCVLFLARWFFDTIRSRTLAFSIAILIIQMFTLTMFTCVHSFNSTAQSIWQPSHTRATRPCESVTARSGVGTRRKTKVWKNVGVPVKIFSKSICILIRCQCIEWMQLFDFWHHAELHSAESFRTQQILVLDWKLETTFLAHFVFFFSVAPAVPSNNFIVSTLFIFFSSHVNSVCSLFSSASSLCVTIPERGERDSDVC